MSKPVKVIIGIVVSLAVILSILSLLPRDVQVERSLIVTASPEQIFPYVNNFHAWRKWSSPANRNAKVEYSYEGPEQGAGAKQIWYGSEDYGFIVITRSQPEKGIWIETAYNSDQINSHGSIVFEKTENGTRVTRTSKAKLPPIFGPIYRGEVESSIGNYLDYSLSKMKRLIESDIIAEAKRIKKKDPVATAESK